MIWEILSELPLENIICSDSIQGAAIVSLASHNLSQTGTSLSSGRGICSLQSVFKAPIPPLFSLSPPVADSPAHIPSPDAQPPSGAGLKHLLLRGCSFSAPSNGPPSLSLLLDLPHLMLAVHLFSLSPSQISASSGLRLFSFNILES